MIKIHQKGRLIKISEEVEQRTITLYCQSEALARQRKIKLAHAIKAATCANITPDIILNNIWANTI